MLRQKHCSNTKWPTFGVRLAHLENNQFYFLTAPFYDAQRLPVVLLFPANGHQHADHHADSDEYADAHTDQHAYGDEHPDAHADEYSNLDSNQHADGNKYPDAYTD